MKLNKRKWLFNIKKNYLPDWESELVNEIFKDSFDKICQLTNETKHLCDSPRCATGQNERECVTIISDES